MSALGAIAVMSRPPNWRCTVINSINCQTLSDSKFCSLQKKSKMRDGATQRMTLIICFLIVPILLYSVTHKLFETKQRPQQPLQSNYSSMTISKRKKQNNRVVLMRIHTSKLSSCSRIVFCSLIILDEVTVVLHSVVSYFRLTATNLYRLKYCSTLQL